MIPSTHRLALTRRRQLAAQLRPRARADDWHLLWKMSGPVWLTDWWFEAGINGYLFDGGSSRADPVPGWYGYVALSGATTDKATSTFMSAMNPAAGRHVDECAYVAYKAGYNQGWIVNEVVRGGVWQVRSYPLDLRGRPAWSGGVHPFMRINGPW